MKYITTIVVKDVSMDIGSDWHLPADKKKLIADFAERIRSEKKSDIFICSGDVFETSDGLDSSDLICTLLKEIAAIYKQVIFVPGNHDLRGRENPWKSFSDKLYSNPDHENWNIYIPVEPTKGCLINLNWIDSSLPSIRVLLCNIFYDMKFLDPQVLNLTKDDVVKFYRKDTNDGKHFLKGDTSLFATMTNGVRSNIDPSIDVLITHALPHPSLVTFRVPVRNEEVIVQETMLGVPFICDPEADVKEGARWNDTAEGFRRFWNLKSFVMGSDVLTGSNFKESLVCIYGHNHRSFQGPQTIDGKKVHFFSHQPNPWTTDYQ